MTDWDEAMEEERAMLNGIVALLFSFARMAERACNRSGIVRIVLLQILRYAEKAAWTLVPDAFIDDEDVREALEFAPPAYIDAFQAGGGRAEAMRLALSFRFLARELSCQAAALTPYDEDCEPAGPRRRAARRLRDLAGFPGAAFAFRAFARGMACGAILPDTS